RPQATPRPPPDTVVGPITFNTVKYLGPGGSICRGMNAIGPGGSISCGINTAGLSDTINRGMNYRQLRRCRSSRSRLR
ncbi:MAG: hypothetical protein ACLGH6_14720, partial [Gammaproteobacteria bacterium]